MKEKMHRVIARHEGVNAQDRLSIPLIKRSVVNALQCEDVTSPCEVSVLITSDYIIRGINNEYRSVDEPTDVLSFPLFEFEPPGWSSTVPESTDPETGLVPLGEIVLSGERVHSQALEYGHPVERETAYLTTHSVLHLLGYDHEEKSDKDKMRDREKHIMLEMGYENDN